MNKTTWAAAMWAASAAFLLTACSGSLSQVRNGDTDHPVWPQPNQARPVVKAWFKPNPENLRKVQQGLPKRDVFALIGAPMHHEGFVGVHEWDYLFRMRGPDGSEVQCQYKVLFDNAMRSSRTMWNTQACADLVNPPAVAQAPALTQIDLAADALFGFDKSVLTTEAASILDSKIVSALEAAEQVDRIKVIGHADELGSAAYNMRLSVQRAEAVKAYLVSRGVPAAAIATEGRGSADPVVHCTESRRAAQIDCLQPNRRVRVEIAVSKPGEGQPESAQPTAAGS
ncbi:MAG TPA: OmpA family protein [Lysobacter sp.]